MVRPKYVRMNVGTRKVRSEIITYKNVVDAPSDVALASTGEWAPPRIVATTLRERAKAIDKAAFNHRINASALRRRKPLPPLVGFRIREVIGRVRDIQVAAKDNRFVLLEPLAVGEEGRVPLAVAQWKPA